MKDCFKILVVSRNKQLIQSFENHLLQVFATYEVLSGYVWKDVCKQTIEHKPLVIFIDAQLDLFEALLLIRILKRLTLTKHIPIVIFSEKNTVLDKYFTEGADDFITLPLNSHDLCYRIQCALRLGNTLYTIKEQNDLLLKQSEELRRQYYLLEEQRKEILDDMTYSRRIQNSIMPTHEMLKALLPNYFLFFRPKRIISGDFYWTTSKNDKVIVAVADCTGHGISGALLTIAGTAFLNEIASYTPMVASEFLNQLRHRMMRLLHQKGVEGEAADGIDISLIIIDFSDLKIQFAGANNSAYIVKSDGTLLILPADRMPIGIHEYYTRPFLNHTLQLEKEDMIYLFTDGYVDQFGGENDQKFRTKRFQQLCINAHKLPMCDQYLMFERTMDEWMGFRDQVDDMLIIGIRV